MNKLLTIILSFTLTILCCQLIQSQIRELNPAAKVISDRITSIENQYRAKSKESKIRFRYVHSIIQLSGITPKDVDGDYNGIHYTPTEEDIRQWKIWFEKNSENFSFVNNDDSKIVEKFKNQKIIQIEYESGKFRYDISESDLKYYREVYPEIIRHGH